MVTWMKRPIPVAARAWRRYAGPVAMALLFCPVAGGSAQAAMQEGVWYPAGTDTAGRNCSARAMRETPPEIPADQAIDVACGRLDRVPNRIFAAPVTNDAVAIGWNRYRERSLNCGPEEPLSFAAAGTEGRIRHCTPVDANWGYVALTITIGNRRYYAIGQGSALPALLQAISLAADRLAEGSQPSPAVADSRIIYEQNMDDGRVRAAAEQYTDSEEAFRKALSVYQTVNGKDSAGAVEVLLPLALTLSNQGRMTEAEQYFNEAAALSKGQPSIAHGVHQAMHHANMHCFATARFTVERLETWLRSRLNGRDADPTGQQANAAATRSGRQYDALNMQIALSPAQAALTRTQFDEDLKTLLYLKAELEYRERRENAMRSSAMPMDCPPSPSVVPVQPAAGNPRDAAARARQTLEVLNSLDKAQLSHAITAFMLRTRSMTYLALNDPTPSPAEINAAIDDLKQVILILEKLNMRERPLAVAHLRLGKAYKLLGRPDEALQYFGSGADLLLKHEQFATIDMLEPYIETLYEQSRQQGPDGAAHRWRMLMVQQLLGDRATARSIAAAATRAESRPTDDIVEEAEEITQIQERRAQIQALRQTRRSDALAQAEGGLRAWENRRANRLRRQQQDAEGRLLRQREEQARLTLGMRSTDQQRITELENDNQGLQADIARIKAELADLPRAALLTQGIVQPERLFKQMQPDEAIVTFFVGHRHTYGIRVTGDRIVDIWRTDMNLEQATQWIDKVLASVTVPEGAPLPQYALMEARSLHVGLFGPDTRWLQGVETLTIVADNVLARLPFGALVTSEVPERGDGMLDQLLRTSWLIDIVATAHASSLKSLVLLREQAANVTPAQNYYISFSNPDLSTPEQFDALAMKCPAQDVAQIKNLKPLPAAAKEVDGVRRILTLPPSIGQQSARFRRQQLMSGTMAGYRILHFASHAILPRGQSECIREPALQISPDPQAPDALSSLLMMSEIEAMTLNADLVILSACDSGGAARAGSYEAMSGLARAFFYANARGLIITAWPVNDRAGYFLILRMMENIANVEQSPAKALRTSQQYMMRMHEKDNLMYKQYIHPYFWAAFSATGNVTRKISYENPS